MRSRLFLLLAFAAAIVFTNVAAAENIAHGVKVVVIDPGHGGRIPGAHYGGTYEKDIVLAVALKLGKMIEEEMPGVKVVYTRKTDKMLGADIPADLQERANIANRANGDLFLSIHANAAPKATGVRGVETLIMGESPKEQRYNESALYENNREDLIDMSDERTAAIVRAYIQNLQFTYGEYSMAFARCIQNSYVKVGRNSRGVKQQLLRVLYATDMPSALTEIGFMSNAQELAFMKSEKGQTEIARSLLKAVKDYSAYVMGARVPEEGVVPEKDTTVTAQPAAKPETPAEKPASETSKPAQKPGEKPAAKPAAKEQPVRYAVQVLASPKAVALGSAHFKSYRNKVKQYSSEGTYRYKYCVFECDDRAAAQKKLAEVRKEFPKAFVVSCKGTQIVKN